MKAYTLIHSSVIMGILSMMQGLMSNELPICFLGTLLLSIGVSMHKELLEFEHSDQLLQDST